MEEALLDLVNLVERRLADGSDEIRSLRRVLDGRHRAADEALLAGRFSGSRLCVVRCSPTYAVVVERELVSAPGVVVDRRGDEVVALVPGLPRHASADAGNRAARVVARVHRVAPQAAVGVSSVLESVHAGVRGLDEARRAACSCPAGKAVYAEHEWFAIALSRLRDSVRDSLVVDGPLSRLEEGSRGVDLRHSLRLWLEADGDTRVAARRLHLHPNTVRYRVRRAAELTGMDFHDPLQRLVAHLALTTEP